MGVDLLDVLREPAAATAVHAYFAEDTATRYIGRRFDTQDGGGTRPDIRDRITAGDLIAVQMLSARVPAEVSIDLLDGQVGHSIADCLREIDADVTLGSPAAVQATTHVAVWSSRTPIRTALYHLTRGRIDGRPRYTIGQLPTLNSPWQDTDSGRYFGWRCRQANLNGEQVFVVEYIVCPHCRIGWVDRPYTVEQYQRNGLSNAGLRALRAEHPGATWHTGSGHMRSSKAFWAAAGEGVLGGYQPRELCAHIARHGGLLPGWLLKRRDRS